MTPRVPMIGKVMSRMLTPRQAAGSVDAVPEPRARTRFADAARQLLREALLDAASDLVRERSWAATTMADIAKVAGVSRQTLYKEFGSRQTFAQAYVIRAADRFLVDVENAVLSNRDRPRDALASAMEVFLKAVADEPLIRAVGRGAGPAGRLALVANRCVLKI
jgi:AcrR family transcriptional regulator